MFKLKNIFSIKNKYISTSIDYENFKFPMGGG